MSNLTKLLAELTQVAPDVVSNGKLDRIKIGKYEFKAFPHYLRMYYKNEVLHGDPAEALLVDALAAECRRRGWEYGVSWHKAANFYLAMVGQKDVFRFTAVEAFVTAFIAAHKAQSPAAG